MHAQLGLEVLEQIFAYVRGRLYLRRLSLVCRIYHVAAIHYLWKDLPSIKPLLMLLPEDAWNPNSVDSSWHLTRILHTEDWQRLRMHARHVRSLGYAYKYWRQEADFLSSDMFVTSLEHVHGSTTPFPLLPALKSLTWEMKSSLHTRAARYLISRQLKSLSFRFETLPATSNFDEIISALASARPPVSDLDLDLAFDTSGHLDLLMRTILPVFTLPCTIQKLAIESRFFVHCVLDILPTLNEVIELKVYQRTSSQTISESTVSKVASRECRCPVKNLRGGTIALWTSFLPLTSQMVESIILSEEFGDITHSDMRRLFQVIGSSCPNLRELVLTEVYVEAEPEDLEGVFVTLLQCAHLEKLVIESHWGSSFDISYSLTDDAIERMAKAWNRLRMLVLNLETSRRDASSPLTLRAVASLKRCCPQLRRLGLTLNLTSPIQLTRLPPSPVPIRVEFGHSHIAGPASLARWLQPICSDISWSDTEVVDDQSRSQSIRNLRDFLENLHELARERDAKAELVVKQARIIDSLREENMALREKLAKMAEIRR